jgi:hypothetical protein
MRIDAPIAERREDIGRRPVQDRPPGPYAGGPAPIGNCRTSPLAAFGTANASHADDGQSFESTLQLGLDLAGFLTRGAEAHARRAPARYERHGAEIFVARDIGLPSGFPLLHQAALFAPHDDNLGSETGSQSFADRSGILLFDEPEIGMDQDAWADVADIVEMSKRCHRRGLAVLAARDTNRHGRASLDQVCNRRRDGDGTS